MYLLHCSQYQDGRLRISLHDKGRDPPPYAILSHRWRPDEVSFRDCTLGQDITARDDTKYKFGYRKLLGVCTKALEDGIEYVWVDTCCIDQSSSAELSEALNSMYRWYEASQRCYAYLDDYDNNNLNGCEWFTRGWTLQELVAPTELIFYDSRWNRIGTRAAFAGQISKATKIRKEVLEDGLDVHCLGVAERMSWAARRITSREEDRAYSLMGLFGVHMPPLYGEGGLRAFERLQEEIIRRSPDHTILAWHGYGTFPSTGVLASSPDQFCSALYYPVQHKTFIRALKIPLHKATPDFAITNCGLHIHLPIAPIEGNPGYYYSFLAASRSQAAKTTGKFAVIYLYRNLQNHMESFARTSFEGRWIGLERVGNRKLKTTPVYLSLSETIAPLILRPMFTLLPPAATSQSSDEPMVTIIFLKKHHSINVADVDRGGCFPRKHEVRMAMFGEQNKIRSQVGRKLFTDPHGRKNGMMSAQVPMNETGFSRECYCAGQHLVTLTVKSRVGWMLVVVAMEKPGLVLLATEVMERLSANEWRERLLSPANIQQRQTEKANSDGQSVIFQATGIPFTCTPGYKRHLGKFSITIEREMQTDDKARAFRVTIGLRPEPPTTWKPTRTISVAYKTEF